MQVRPVYSREEVETRLDELAARLYRDYADSPLSIVCIAEGARRFVEALTERLTGRGLVPEVHMVRARRTEGSELSAVQVDAFDPSALEERDVLVVDDIIDEGATIRAVLELVGLAEPRTVRTAVLVDKLERPREVASPDYVGFEIERGWVVGFGMDLNGEFRDLEEIGVVLNDD